MSFKQYVLLLASDDLLTPSLLKDALSIKEIQAVSLLSRWHDKGVVRRLAQGCYASIAAHDGGQKALFETLRLRLGQTVLIGPSVLERAGIAPSNTLHLATAHKPTEHVPSVEGVITYPLGAKQFSRIAAHAEAPKKDRPLLPRSLLLTAQTRWWFEGSCPAPMPDPQLVDMAKLKINEEFYAGVNGGQYRLDPENIPELYIRMAIQTSELLQENEFSNERSSL